jgi:adenosylhomocysteine nucleosidase
MEAFLAKATCHSFIMSLTSLMRYKQVAEFFAFLVIGALNCSASEWAFFYALDADLGQLKKAGHEVRRPYTSAGRTIHTIQLGPHVVHALRMESGCVESTLSAQLLFSRMSVDKVISVGPVGALSKDLSVGTWVRVAGVVSHQKGAETASGFQLSDAAKMSLDTFTPAAIPDAWKKAPSGIVASGEVFVASAAAGAALRTLTGATIVDMNLFGIQTVVSAHQVPHLAMRIVSDQADQNAPHAFREFIHNYAGEGGRWAAVLILAESGSLADPQTHGSLRELLE